MLSRKRRAEPALLQNEREDIMAKIPTCRNCGYSYFDACQWLVTVGMGWPSGPVCANHPDSLGQMRRTPAGGVCRNYRPRPETPMGEVKQIPLSDGAYAYVDAADFEWLSRWIWSLCNGYAGRRENGKLILMHREITQASQGMVVDHWNRNKLDNTRDNLHVCTQQENVRWRGPRSPRRPIPCGQGSLTLPATFCRRRRNMI